MNNFRTFGIEKDNNYEKKILSTQINISLYQLNILRACVSNLKI